MSVPTLRRAIAAACTSFALASAQQPTPQPAPQQPAPTTPTNAPAAPAKVDAAAPERIASLRLAGPAIWRAHFGPTNVGGMFASEVGNGLWLRAIDPVEQTVRRLLHLDDAGYALARQRLVDYGGALEVEVWFAGTADLPLVTLRLLGDGKTDTAALARDCAALLAAASGKPFVAVPGTELRAVPLPNDGPWLTEPMAIDRDVVAAIAAPQAVAAAHALARHAAAAVPDTRPAVVRPPLQFHFDTGAALRRFGRDDIDTKLWRALGGDTLDQLDFSISARGPHVQFELAHTFTAGDRGLFAVLFPERPALPQFAAIPVDEHAVKYGHLDLSALYEPIVRGLVANGTARAEAEKDVAKFLGGKDDGFLAQFTGEYILAVGTGKLFGDDGNADWGILLRTKPDSQMQKLWPRLLGTIGSGDGEQDLGGGYRIYHQGGFFDFDVVVGPELFGITFGQWNENLAPLLEAHRRGEWQQAPAVPERLRQWSRIAPPGWNGFAEGDLAPILSQHAAAFAWLREMDGDVNLLQLLERDVATEDWTRLQQLLEDNHLRRATSLTGYADHRWCLRVFW